LKEDDAHFRTIIPPKVNREGVSVDLCHYSLSMVLFDFLLERRGEGGRDMGAKGSNADQIVVNPLLKLKSYLHLYKSCSYLYSQIIRIQIHKK
jgi:hypothetical protein